MSYVNVLSNTSTASTTSSTSSSSTTSGSALDQDAFLTLLVTQLQNQDPTNPTDSTEYLSQLAQFSTVSGIEGMQSSLTELTESLRGSQVLDGTALVGHDIMVAGDTVTLGDTGSAAAAVTIPDSATDVTLTITNSAGEIVRQMPLSTTAGTLDISWDGTTSLGERAAAGEYTLAVSANVGGESTALETQIATHVDSVSLDSTNYSLTVNTDQGSIALTDVRRVL